MPCVPVFPLLARNGQSPFGFFVFPGSDSGVGIIVPPLFSQRNFSARVGANNLKLPSSECGVATHNSPGSGRRFFEPLPFPERTGALPSARSVARVSTWPGLNNRRISGAAGLEDRFGTSSWPSEFKLANLFKLSALPSMESRAIARSHQNPVFSFGQCHFGTGLDDKGRSPLCFHPFG